MTLESVKKTIAGVIQELQQTSGRPCGELTGSTKPIGDLIGFDSLSAIEATIAIEAALGQGLDVDNVLVAETNGRKRALTIAGAAERIMTILKTQVA